MLKSVTLGVAAAAASFALAAPASAADLGRGYGSIKDAPVYVEPTRSVSCYVRGDVGHAWGVSKKADGWAEGGPKGAADVKEFDDSVWLGEVGLGCGISRAGGFGIRGDMTYGFRGSREFHGVVPMPSNMPPTANDVYSKVSTKELAPQFRTVG